MTDGDLDPRRARELRAYAERGVRPIHAMAIAEAATSQHSRRSTPLVWSWPSAAGRGTSAKGGSVSPTPRIATRTAAAGLAIAAVVVAVIAVAANSLMPSAGVVGAPQPTASPTPAPTVWPSRSPGATDASPGPGFFNIGRHSVEVAGVPFSYEVPARWDPFGSFLVSKSVVGPQGAEGIVFWAGFPDGLEADPCINAPIDRWFAPADVAAGIAEAPGTELVSAPTDVTVGGHPAKHVVVVVREDAGCDPGFFYNWKAQTGGSLWTSSELGDRIGVWVVDVDGQLIFIAGETHENLTPSEPFTEGGRAELEQEIQDIVDSIRFD